MLEKLETINELLDAYALLLTAKQLDIITLYYREDLSYQEIADNLEISKSAVYDTIKTVEKLLISYEEKVGYVLLNKKVNTMLDKLEQLKNKDVNKLIVDYKKD
ncbi:MAG: HTH domain-containing protein [Erysipelothrix sp.]|nr:HTH domain-containing protein [Erysipelothrix sp.]